MNYILKYHMISWGTKVPDVGTVTARLSQGPTQSMRLGVGIGASGCPGVPGVPGPGGRLNLPRSRVKGTRAVTLKPRLG